ncbi:MAG: cbb3-type cytochrome c oxidase subunit I, partial [Kiritimatiellia bacterium]
NGLLTMRGAWDRLRTDYSLKFMVVAISFYGMSTFEGPMMSIRAVSGLSHFTNWVIGHVHSGALGWNGMITFAILYWLVPRLWKKQKLWSHGMAEAHFWIATTGIVLYTVSMWTAGVMEGLMWRAVDENGLLVYPIFMDIVNQLTPYYWLRMIGGTLFFTGMCMQGFNLLMTIMGPNAETSSADSVPQPAK